jgi:hypothetical protein|tara:strand:+ start:1775 stop:2020 length:246 start_codon:yes stop_codon:yes gene_type:complete
VKSIDDGISGSVRLLLDDRWLVVSVDPGWLVSEAAGAFRDWLFRSLYGRVAVCRHRCGTHTRTKGGDTPQVITARALRQHP